jgi:choline dehydrogenase-like flavoprotein
MAHTDDDVATYDYIVIGGGTSGSVAARRLAEGEAHYSVCLLEAGPRFALSYSLVLIFE